MHAGWNVERGDLDERTRAELQQAVNLVHLADNTVNNALMRADPSGKP